MCTCVQNKMSSYEQTKYDQRQMLPKNRSERRRMLKAMTRKEGNFTKKTKSHK